ncbi:MAG: hypothetical protein ACKPKO_09590, partial [Candidatus Fonsibacter sp.]
SDCIVCAGPHESKFDEFECSGGSDVTDHDWECLFPSPWEGQYVACTGSESSDADEDHAGDYFDRVRGVFGGIFDILGRFSLADRIFGFLSPRSVGRLQNSHTCFEYLALPLFFEKVCAGSCCSSGGSAGWRSLELFAVVD